MPGTSIRESNNIAALNQWANRDENDLVLVHALRHFTGTQPLLINNANDVFKTWDVISTSLISIREVKRQYKTSLRSRLRPMIGEVAFILDVPPQNIIGTFCSDGWFPNHAGREGNSPTGRVINSYALFDSIRSGITQKGKVTKGGCNQVYDPKTLLGKTPDNYHNECLIVGRGGVNTYSGFPVTVDLRVKGIIYAPHHHLDRDIGNNDSGLFLAHKLLKKNGLPKESMILL